ncbi:MAG TPA: SpoIIE family protein phosphatase [Pseudomonadales bacterium]|nr:SpoIIE family protein phosphatase [Pseudomonadales bacterium]
MSQDVLIAGAAPAPGKAAGNPGPKIEPMEHSGETVAGIPSDLRSLVNHNMSLAATTSLEEAQKFFGTHDLEFIAVVENGRAIGLCARRQIGIVLGSRYGFSLFSRNPVRDHLVPQALLIRTTDSIHTVLKRLAARRDEFFYEDVLLQDKEGNFVGSIFVRNLVRLQHGMLLDNIGQLEQNRAEIERKNAQMEQELIMAGKVQQAMLSQICPTFPPGSSTEASVLQFHHRFLPAGKVSGDFFYVSRISDHVAGVFICDVMGHGVRSAMITSMLRALVEELQCDADKPGELLTQLNDDLFAILRQNDETMYATAIYLLIDTANLQVRWASAGHPSPLLLRGRDSVEPLPLPREKRGKVLGLVASSHYETGEAALQPGDKLLLYTDGIFEIFEGDKEFGINGLTATLRQNLALPTPQLLDKVLQTARAFSRSNEFEDDVCLLAIDTAEGKKS